jgi:hypothetical protein
MSFDDIVDTVGAFLGRCPSDHPDHRVLELDDDALAADGLPRGSRIHVHLGREPNNGDLVWAELVRHGSMQRLVRRYKASHDFVTLMAPGSNQPDIIRRYFEVRVLGVVEPSPPTSFQARSS